MGRRQSQALDNENKQMNFFVSADKLSVNADFRWCLNAKLVYDEHERKKNHTKNIEFLFLQARKGVPDR